MSKTCSTCGKNKDAIDFYKDKRSSDGLTSGCKQCLLTWQRKYRSKNKEQKKKSDAKYRASIPIEVRREREKEYRKSGQKKHAEYVRNWRKQHPKKAYAHNVISNLIRTGELIRPNSCAKCGDSGVKIEASHGDYNEPKIVEWLCPRCHRIKDDNPFMHNTAQKALDGDNN